MSNLTPHPDELHAYVDGQLPDARRAAVDAWLAVNPDAAERVRGWRRDADALRARWGGTATLPAEPRLDPARIRRRVRADRWAGMGRAALLVMALGLGGISGWLLHGVRGGGPAALPMADAVTAYRLLADQQVSMDFEAGRMGGLQDWLAQNFEAAGRVPDLTSQGYALRGARMLSTPEGAAAMLVYEDQRGATLGVYIRPRPQRLREGQRRDGGLVARYWTQGDTAIAVVSSHFDDRADAVAPLLRRGG